MDLPTRLITLLTPRYSQRAFTQVDPWYGRLIVLTDFELFAYDVDAPAPYATVLLRPDIWSPMRSLDDKKIELRRVVARI